MKVMGLDNAGKLEYLALDSEIDYTSFEENLPGMVWRKVREDEAPDAAFQQADFLEKPLKDSEGRHNYRISPKGVMVERVWEEMGEAVTKEAKGGVIEKPAKPDGHEELRIRRKRR